jgi:hypothetical protein
MPCSVEVKLWIRDGAEAGDGVGRPVAECGGDGDGVSAWLPTHPTVPIATRATAATANLAYVFMVGKYLPRLFIREPSPRSVFAATNDVLLKINGV